jgi:hypothetical protein
LLTEVEEWLEMGPTFLLRTVPEKNRQNERLSFCPSVSDRSRSEHTNQIKKRAHIPGGIGGVGNGDGLPF